MTKLKKLALTSALVTAVIVPFAGANAEGTSATSLMQQFKSLDSDRNGTLSESEYNKMSGAGDFGAADTNGDNTLTLSELQATSSTKGRTGASGSNSGTSADGSQGSTTNGGSSSSGSSSGGGY